MKTLTVKYVPLAQRVVKRFIKVFFLAGLASALVVPPLQGLDRLSWEIFALSVFNGFVSGCLAGLEKYLNGAK